MKQLTIKPDKTMQQDTLNQIYLESKQLNLSQTMYTIFTEIDEIDGSNDGYITAEEFADGFVSIGLRSQTKIDFLFLAKKYKVVRADDDEELERVYYRKFYEDYAEIERKGLSEHVFGITSYDNDDVDYDHLEENHEV